MSSSEHIRYAQEFGRAVYDLARERGVQTQVLNGFETVAKVFEDKPEFLRLLSNPRLGVSEREELVNSVFGGRIEPVLLNAVKLLAAKRRCGMLESCLQGYRALYCRENNILAVKVTSAVELDEVQKSKLCKTLEKKTGSKVLLHCRTDPSCLGGICLEYDGKRYDASVRQKLSSLRESLKSDC